LAAQFGISQHEEVNVVTKRGDAIFAANIVETIREDTVFIPYHWPGKKSANQLTSGHLDPISKIPEFKVSACNLIPTGEEAVIGRDSEDYRGAHYELNKRRDMAQFYKLREGYFVE